MGAWRIEALPSGYTVTHTVDATTSAEWYTVRHTSGSSVKLTGGHPGFQADLDAFVASTVMPLAATTKAALLHERNRWLAQTDPYVLPTGSLPSDMPAAVLAAISGNQAEIVAWRQQLRDYPSTVTDWAQPPPLPLPPAVLLPTGQQLVIVT